MSRLGPERDVKLAAVRKRARRANANPVKVVPTMGASKSSDSNETQKSGIAKRYKSLRKGVRYLSGDPIVRILTFGLVVLTFIQLLIDLNDRDEQRAALQEERIYRAWLTLLNTETTDAAKGKSLEFLFSNGESFAGIDLSCETMGRGWNPDTNECENPIRLVNLNLGSPLSKPVVFQDGPTVSGNSLGPAGIRMDPLKKSTVCFGDRLRGTPVDQDSLIEAWDAQRKSTTKRRDSLLESGANFTRANLSGIQFRNSHLSGATFDYSYLDGALLDEVTAEGASFYKTSLNGTLITDSIFDLAYFDIGDLAYASDVEKYFLEMPEKDRVWFGNSRFNKADVTTYGSPVFVGFVNNEMRNAMLSFYSMRTVTDDGAIPLHSKNASSITLSDLSCSYLRRSTNMKIVASKISSTVFGEPPNNDERIDPSSSFWASENALPINFGQQGKPFFSCPNSTETWIDITSEGALDACTLMEPIRRQQSGRSTIHSE